MVRDHNQITITEAESKHCLVCNKTFISSKLATWHIKKEHNLSFEQYVIQVYYDDIRPVCLKTGNKLAFKAHKLGPWFSNYSKNNFPRTPHSEQSKLKIKQGCEQASLKKYGVKNVFSTDWCKEKIKNTNIAKYGVENVMQTADMKELFSTFSKSNTTVNKTKTTNLKKYGELTFTATEQSKLQLRKYNYTKFYNDWGLYTTALLSRNIQCLNDEAYIVNLQRLNFKCTICNFEWDGTLLMPFCTSCADKFHNSRSIEESSLMKWLKESGAVDFNVNKRFNINGKVYEADIVIESKKIIIELNGLYWHSEEAGKDKTYHINKLTAFESIGYTVLQIFEDEWLFKTDLVKNKILHKLNCNTNLPAVYARKCDIKIIKNTESNLFLEETHIQGGTNAHICYGAYYNGELLAVMTFSKPRRNMGNKKTIAGEYELVRFSTSKDYRVIGVAGKLLKCFISEYAPLKITSYADKRWTNSNSNLYSKIGFKLIGATQPNYWYVKKYKREYRFKYTKQKLIAVGQDPAKTEKEIMRALGYNRIWDCGHLKFELIISV